MKKYLSTHQLSTTIKSFSGKINSLTGMILLIMLLLITIGDSSFAAIALRGTPTTANITSGTSLTINKPTGVVAGDVMIAHIWQRNNTSTVPSLAGWTQIATANPGAASGDGISNFSVLLYKVAGGSEPANYAFVCGSGITLAIGNITAFSGCTATPLDVTGTFGTGTVGNPTPATTITTISADAAVVMFAGQYTAFAASFSSWATVNAPTALTELYDNGAATGSNNILLGAGWVIKPTVGATGQGRATYTPTGNNRYAAIMISLKPSTCVTPTTFNVTGGGSYCSGGSGVAVGLNGGESGVTYQLLRNGSTTGMPSPVSSAIAFDFSPNMTSAGTYTVVATRTTGGCTSTMTGNAVVSINSLPATPTGGVLGTNPICSGASSTVQATSAGNTINWYDGGNNFLGTSASATPFVVTPSSASTTYFAEAETGAGCKSAAKLNVGTITWDQTAPIPNSVTLNNYVWVTGAGTNHYFITVKATDAGVGLGGSKGIQIRINEQGANAGTYGGWFAWHPTNATILGGNQMAVSSGTGFVAQDISGTYGDLGITLVGATESLSSGQETIVFEVVPDADYPELLENDISMEVSDACDNITTWTNFETDFTSVLVANVFVLGTIDNAGPIDFCEASGDYVTAGVTLPEVSGASGGTIKWQYGFNNGTWSGDVATGISPPSSVFAPKTNNTDGLQKDKVRWLLRFGADSSGYSAPVLINNHYNADPTSLTANYSHCSNTPTSITLTAHFAGATNILGTVDFYSGSCGGTLIASVPGNGTTSVSTATTAPMGSTDYYAQYNPGTGVSCTPGSCQTVNANVTAFPTAPVVTFTDNSSNSANDGIICRNDAVTLDAGSYTTYAWNTGGTDQTIVVSPTGTTTYTVTVTDANVCTATSTATVTVNQLPIPSIAATENSGNAADDGTICIDAAPTVLDAGSYSSYVWNTAETTQTITTQPLSTTGYAVTVTDVNVCSAQASRTITVNALPIPTINAVETSGNAPNDGIICTGTSVTLSTGSFTAYAWSTGGTNQTISVSPTATTTYYSVTVTNANGCTNSTSFEVVVNSNPSAQGVTFTEVSGNTNDDGTICRGASVTLDGGVGTFTEYLWNTGATTETIAVSPTSTTTYTVTGYDVNHCFASSNGTVIVNALPVPVITSIENSGTASNNGTICIGDGAVLTTTVSYSSYLWSTTEVTPSISIAPTTNTTYTVSVIDGNNCAANGTILITVKSLPAVPTITIAETSGLANDDGITCTSASVVLNAGTFTTYNWSTGNTTSAITVTPATTTGYTVTVTNSDACLAANSTSITVNPYPATPNVSVNNTCLNSELTITNPEVGVTFLWTPGGATTNPINTGTNGTYTVTQTSTNGCTSPASSVATAAPLTVPGSFTVNAASPTFCNYNGDLLTVSGVVNGTIYFQGTTSGGTSTVFPYVNGETVTTSGTYYFRALNTCGWGPEGSVTVTDIVPVVPGPISGNATQCKNTGLQVYSISTITNADSYQWNLPPGWTFTGANNGNSVTVNIPNTTNTGTISVHGYNNTCGGGPDQTLPVSWGACTTAVCAGSTHNYSVPAVMNATSYTWAVPSGSSITSPSSTGNAITVTFGTSSGNITVAAVDACGSSPLQTLGITVNPLPTISVGSNSPVCVGTTLNLTSTGSGIDVIAWTGPDAFSSSDPNPTISNVTLAAAGTYSALATTTSSGCTNSATTVVVVNTNPSVSETHVNANCFGESNGSIDLSVTDGTPAYQYAWSNGSTTQDLTGIAAGTYSVTVTDANNCTAVTSVITIGQPDELLISCSGNDISCNNLDDGDASVSASGGTPSYAYLWSPGGATTSSISGLTNGTYSVTVTDAHGCSKTCTQVINRPDLLTVTAGYNGGAPACDGNNINLTSSVAGGTGSVTYEWFLEPSVISFSTNANPVVTGAVTGTYTYTVKIIDSKGCVATDSKEVIVHGTPSGALFANTNADFETTICVGNGGTLMILAGGSGTITGTLWDGVSTTLASYSGVATQIDIPVTPPVGTTIYYLQSMYDQYCAAKVVDIIGVDPVTVHVLPSPTVDITTPATTELTCATTSILLETTTDFADTYLWTPNGETTDDITVTLPGTYSVTGTETTSGYGCTGSDQIVITQNITPPVLSIDPPPTTELTCVVTSILLNTSGTSVSYLWNTAATTSSISVSSPGTYSVTSTGTNGCTNTASIVITQNITAPTATASSDIATITCTNPVATLTATGGGTYLWSNGSTNAVTTVTTGGTYTVTVTSANGCTDDESVIVGQDNTPPTATASSDIATITCTNPVATLTATGGGTYLWSNGSTDAVTTVILGGTYTVIVTIANGCTDDASVVVGFDKDVTATASSDIATITCTNPIATLTATGGVSYLWSNGSTDAVTTVITGGTYTVVLTAANGCTDDASVVVGFDKDVTATASSDIATITCTNPVATLTATGGVSYLWSNGSTDAVTTVTTGGTYSVVVTAANGCTDDASVVVGQDNTAPTATASSDIATITCTNPVATLTAIGGGTYLWSNGSTNAVTTVTTGGTYTVVVTTANGCTDDASVVVGFDKDVTATASSDIATITCTNPVATLTATGGVSYLWSNGSTDAITTVTTGGTYTVIVTAANGCTDDASVVVDQDNTAPTATASSDIATITCTNPVATLTATGGVSYLWSNGSTDAVTTVTTGGTYIVIVTAANGCTDDASVVVGQDNIAPTATASSDIATITCTNPVATLTATGGVSYLWSNGSTDAVTTVTTGGTYTVIVTAVNGCTDDASVVVGFDKAATATASSDIATITCTNPVATLTATGGVSYLWSNGSTDAVTTVTTGGTYTVVVTAANGCTDDASVVVGQDNTATATASSDIATITCTNPVATLTATGGITYLWSNGSTDAVTTVTTGGTYTVVATAANGCTDDASVVVGQDNTAPTATASSDIATITCTNPVATLTATGGVSYMWSNGSTDAVTTVTTGGTYTVIVTAANGCTDDASVVVGQDNTAPTATITPSGATTFCSGGNVTLDAGAGYSAYLWSNSATTQTVLVSSSGTYTVTVTSANGCTATSAVTTVTVNICNTALNLKLYIQGYYSGTGLMQPVLFNQTMGVSATETDTILVELRDEFNTSNVITSAKGLLMTDGSVLSTDGVSNFEFPGAYTGTYWIAVKHRNALETWSSSAVSFATTPTYDFSSAANKALYDNQILVDAGLDLYGFYSGDIIQDGFIGIDDVNVANNDNLSGLFFDYLATDINGDGFVGIDDVNIVNNNNLAGIFFLP